MEHDDTNYLPWTFGPNDLDSLELSFVRISNLGRDSEIDITYTNGP
jgi:hypothetical protein